MSASDNSEITDSQLQKIRDTQRDAWDRSSAGWKQWDDVMMAFLKPIGDVMIRMMDLQPNDDVLDVASGTGEPGLSIASIVDPGQVTATDLSSHMLAVAEEYAQLRKQSNFQTRVSDASALPFPDNTFDAVSCRLGLMFFPDIGLALQEMNRVLKPGGVLSIAVWHEAARNPWITTSMGTMIDMLGLQQPGPNAPGLFRCANEDWMLHLLQQHGFVAIDHALVGHHLTFGSFDHYWQFVSGVATPTAYKQADEATKARIQSVLREKIHALCGEGIVQLGSCAIVIGGQKM